ncbi:MAG TPA: hypothetical protein VG347_12845 [Verrucomicrobiae bacterium]|nr:hypothetical protein [Verrucomicrobiae bacterium]
MNTSKPGCRAVKQRVGKQQVQDGIPVHAGKLVPETGAVKSFSARRLSPFGRKVATPLCFSLPSAHENGAATGS